MKTISLLFISIITTQIALSQGAEPSPIRTFDFNPLMEPFYHGVASGDPLTDRVIIWTRVTPDSSSPATIDVDWRFASDTGMTNIVTNGSTTTDAAKDYTVKVDVTGLQANTYYYYDFYALNQYSIRGRTKTTPTGDVDSLRFAIVSCSNYEAGYFNAYASIKSRNDVDAVLHLGDYIYEYEQGGYSPNANISNRDWLPANEIITLTDYRSRYNSYHLDQDLRELHQQFPMINIWDDHETANDSWFGGAENHDGSTEGDWFTRKGAGTQAFHEWLPIRELVPGDSTIYRKIPYGDLLDLYMLDTRLHGRDIQDGTSNTDTTRTMLGMDQRNWLRGNLSTGTAQWNILGQQVMVAPLTAFGIPVNSDQWDGYPGERDLLLGHVYDNSLNDIVVLTGDIHTSWANNLEYNGNAAGVEFVATSVTSPGFPFAVPSFILTSSNPHIEWLDLTEKGFIILDVNKQKVTSEWYFVPTIDTQTDQATHETSYHTLYGSRVLSAGGSPISPRPGLNVTPAPGEPVNTISVGEVNAQPVIFGVYPNPFNQWMEVQYLLQQPENVQMLIRDLSGRTLKEFNFGSQTAGVQHVSINLGDKLSSGIYILSLQSGNQVVHQKIVKQ